MISGLQKMTLLDFPGKVACTVFLAGCNFRCPFCHNSGLLTAGAEPVMTEEELLAFLTKRQGLLDGVCISGGEPTLYPGLYRLLERIKALGYPIKLDTNGSRPEVLEELVAAGLLDYVAMDIKNCPEKYALTTGMPNLQLQSIEKSIRFLLVGNLEYEFRTTVVEELHDVRDADKIGIWLQQLDPAHRAGKFFLQSYVDRESVLVGGLHAPSEEKMQAMAEKLAPWVEAVKIRGKD